MDLEAIYSHICGNKKKIFLRHIHNFLCYVTFQFFKETSQKILCHVCADQTRYFKPKRTRTESPEDNADNLTKRNVKFNIFVFFKETYINSKDSVGFINGL